MWRKLCVYLAFPVGGFCGYFADDFGSPVEHLQLAVVFAIILPVFLALDGKLSALITPIRGDGSPRLKVNPIWVPLFFLGVFSGRGLALLIARTSFMDSLLLASPFLGMAAGNSIYLALKGINDRKRNGRIFLVR